ncbi:unnamed protein product [Bathycoccus prasinos]
MFESPTKSGGFGASCEREVSQTLVQHTFPGGRYPKRNIEKVPEHYRSRNAKETRCNTNTIPRKTQGISGDINTGLQHLGFSGIYWTTSYGFKKHGHQVVKRRKQIIVVVVFTGERRGNESKGDEATFARDPERKPGMSAGSSRPRAGARGEYSLKRLVIGSTFEGVLEGTNTLKCKWARRNDSM